MRDQDPLLLTPREAPDPVVGEPIGIDVVEHLLDQFPLLPGPTPEPGAEASASEEIPLENS